MPVNIIPTLTLVSCTPVRVLTFMIHQRGLVILGMGQKLLVINSKVSEILQQIVKGFEINGSSRRKYRITFSKITFFLF